MQILKKNQELIWEDTHAHLRASVESAVRNGADLRGAQLQDADLRGADLQGAKLEGVNLHGAQLQGADLRDADLQGAKLEGVNLHGAQLQGAKLQGADLGEDIPTVENIHLQIYEALLPSVEGEGIPQNLQDGRISQLLRRRTR